MGSIARSELDRRARRLVGKRLVGVRYLQIAYADGGRHWHERGFHLLDHGLELEIEGGSVYGITWGWEFTNYGLSLVDGTLSGVIADARVWDVSAEPEWADLIGRRIAAARLYWCVSGARADDTWYPQDLEVGFGEERVVYISASEYSRAQDRLVAMSDAIVVTMGSQIARQYQIGPYAQEACVPGALGNTRGGGDAQEDRPCSEVD